MWSEEFQQTVLQGPVITRKINYMLAEMFKINCIHFTELINGHIWLRSITNIAISYFTTSLWVRQWFHCIMYHIFLIIEWSKMHKTNNKFSTFYSFVVVCCWVKHSSHTVPLSDQECFINRWMMNSMGKGVIPCLTR